MRCVRPLVFVWLAATWIPGVGELFEDAAHLVLDGATDHGEHEPCPEHGCTPTAHHCSCCASAVVAQLVSHPAPIAPVVAGEALEWPSEERERPGIARRISRPPAA
jgi:hypothetical protein